MFLCVFGITAATVMLVCDAFAIPLVMRPLFKAALRDTMLDDLRLAPAALFYVVHGASLVWFAGRTAQREGVAAAARDGAMLGLAAYSCYEMTSHTIMRAWTWDLVVIDVAWGVTMSAFAAWVGARVAGHFAGLTQQ
jgi:uncharacterized membrane protein